MYFLRFCYVVITIVFLEILLCRHNNCYIVMIINRSQHVYYTYIRFALLWRHNKLKMQQDNWFIEFISCYVDITIIVPWPLCCYFVKYSFNLIFFVDFSLLEKLLEIQYICYDDTTIVLLLIIYICCTDIYNMSCL